MAEAMINDKYMQATIPALSMQSSQDHDDSKIGHHHESGRRLSKVVGFDVPLQVKRQRPNTEITAQNVTLGELRNCIFMNLSQRPLDSLNMV